MNICDPVMEAYAICHSYACRKGKGTLAALRQTRKFAGKYAWFLKLDIRKYFDFIDHSVLQKFLSDGSKTKTSWCCLPPSLPPITLKPAKACPSAI
jgi:RNA-directed DNA polymerase